MCLMFLFFFILFLSFFFFFFFFFFSSRRRHTRFDCDWSSDVCSSDLTSCINTISVRLHLIFRLESVAFSLPFSPCSLKANGSTCDRSNCRCREQNGNHNNENLFDLFARQCALCRLPLSAGSCPAE